MASSRRMDINSLLSPSESPSPGTPPEPPHVKHFPSEPVLKRPGRPRKTHTSSVLEQSTVSPLRQTGHSAPIITTNGIAHYDFGASVSPTSAPTSQPLRNGYRPAPGATDATRPAIKPPSESDTQSPPKPPPSKRMDSTERMDFLADLASMQHPQHTTNRTNSQNPRSGDSSDSPTMPYAYAYAASNSSDADRRASSSSSRRDSIIPAELPLSDIHPATLEPRDFKATSLSEDELERISTLTQLLSEDSFLYESHAELVTLLHQGLRSHISPTNSDNLQDPTEYGLTTDLRQARDAMDSRFPLGEEMMIQWIHDEIMLAKTVEEKIAVVELCRKGVQQEKGSPTLWRLYGDWVSYLFKTMHDAAAPYSTNFLEEHPVVGKVLEMQKIGDDEKSIGREIIGWDNMLNVWSDGTTASQWRINDSHIVFDPYFELLTRQLSINTSPERLNYVSGLFADRLCTPHATWDRTFQMFSEYIKKHHKDDDYETSMANANTQGRDAKEAWGIRQESEISLERAIEAGDRETEWTVMCKYIDWEARQMTKKNAPSFASNLLLGLFERANIRFPTDPGFWEDHLDFVTTNSQFKRGGLDLAHRATRHCPWSGNLWSKHILALEESGKGFKDLEKVKHDATSTGLLEKVANMEDIIELYCAFCGFLRRKAFSASTTVNGDEKRDVAEVAIRSAIEDVRAIGEKRYGKSYIGDPLFRVERIYAKFLYQAGRLDDSRRIFSDLIRTHGNDWTFWDKYYMFEMVLWGKSLGEQAESLPPHRATAVLETALEQNRMDFPEKILALYVHHVKQHEVVQKVQEALANARRIGKNIEKRRISEAQEAAQKEQDLQQQEYQEVSEPGTVNVGDSGVSTKRKREESMHMPDESYKRARPEELQESKPQSGDASSSATAQVKRDRENSSLVMTQLPLETTEESVRKFLKGCGKILALDLTKESDGNTMAATIEFESREDVLSALTRSKKPFLGQEIEMTEASSTTLWVTNYPPEVDDAWIRAVFEPYGEVVQVRFPSLRYNAHRRFCYVQFLTAAQATQASEALDGRKETSSNGEEYTMTARISDPSQKMKRRGATDEGRELFIRELHFKATDDELKHVCSKFGTVESVRIPRNVKGGSKGFAFVTMSTKEQAENAAAELDQSTFRKRVIRVEVAGGTHRPKETSTTVWSKASSYVNGNSHDRSATPSSETQSPSSTMANGNANGLHTTSRTNIQKQKKYANDPAQSTPPDWKSRTVNLNNLSDTVREERINDLMRPFGAILKTTLYPKHYSARIEYESADSATKAIEGMNGFEITPGRYIKAQTLLDSEAKAKSARRERQKGRRGGLGAVEGHEIRAAARSAEPEGDSQAGAPKSNDWFKNFVRAKTSGGDTTMEGN